MEELLPTLPQQAQDQTQLMLPVPSRIVLEPILIVLEDLLKMGPTLQMLHQVQIHQVQQPVPRIEAETYQRQRPLNQLLRTLTQMQTVRSGIT